MPRQAQANLAAMLTVASLLLASSIPQAAAQEATTDLFNNVTALGTQLQRGKATKADVRRLLGAPNGDGGGFFPGMQGDFTEIWFYHYMDLITEGKVLHTFTGRVSERLLLVFFKGEVMNGYMWSINAGDPLVR